MQWAFFGGIASLVLAGCSLLVDTGDLAGGPGKPDGGGTDALVTPGTDAGGTSDGGAEGGIATCPVDALLCIDFENGFGPLEAHGQVEIVSDIVHGGTHAFRATTHPRQGTAGNSAEVQLHLPAKIAPGDVIYFRAYVYFPAQLQPETTISKWRSTGDEDMNLKIDSQGHLKVDADLQGEGPELSGVDMAPIGKWICIDWTATFGTPGHELLLMDGVKEIDAAENNLSPNSYDEIGLGFVTFDTPVDESVYFDDVIISKSHVGCP